jgi:hypothetical protein
MLARRGLSGMGNVISYAAIRAEKVKAKLCALADSQSPGLVETQHGPIDAQRIFCRDSVAVLIDRYGVQTRLAYGDIADVSPILPVADIVRFADWQVIEVQEQPDTATVLAFPPRW